MKLDKEKRTLEDVIKENKNKSWLIGIGLITAGVIGLWALHSSQKNKPREIFEKVIKKLQQDIPPIMSELPITEKISKEFLTYENDKYGIEVKYPKNWTKIWEEKKQFGGVTDIITFVAL